MRWAGHIAHMARCEMHIRFCLEISKEEMLWRPGHRCEDNIKINSKNKCSGGGEY
jgi:hypothetical protein